MKIKKIDSYIESYKKSENLNDIKITLYDANEKERQEFITSFEALKGIFEEYLWLPDTGTLNSRRYYNINAANFIDAIKGIREYMLREEPTAEAGEGEPAAKVEGGREEGQPTEEKKKKIA